MLDDEGLTFKALCEESGLSERTVRYYMQQGLLPAAARSGPGVRYPQSHLARLRLVRRWQEEFLPLEQIRKVLAETSDAEAERLAEAGSPAPVAPGSAADYVRSVLKKAAPAHSPSDKPPEAPRSQWERIVLDADVELHVRRPLSHVTNRKVEALVAEARKILKPESDR